ncbi:MAG: 2-octaprenyl-6-methoxyphenyl hydroxylase [Oceanospirillaceae bacterium]|nr:2-octaprenyl-6-methoxyphenyl hydroxylase [Oceanospirillaceae bacterium]
MGQSNYDLMILGAGMTGASLVHLLHRAREQGMRIALLERQSLNWEADAIERPPSFDGRATALSWGTRLLLEQMNCWQHISDRACAIEHIQVSDHGRFGQTHLHASEQDTEALGYIVENAVLGYGLLKDLESTGVTLMPNTQVDAVQMTADGASLTLSDGDVLSTRLLVMADGARSGLAAKLGINHQRQSYGTSAIVTQVKTDQPHQHWAYERFSDAGPIAFLPLHQRQFAVVWTLPEETVDDVMALSDEDFLHQLQQQIGHRLGNLMQVGERATYPLALVRSDEQVRRSLVLLGNAAHSLHPVAGQGFNLALRDTAVLSEHLTRAWQAGQSPGDLSVLQAYAEQQQRDQSNTIIASDLLPKIFSHPGKLTAIVRDAGLMGLAAVPVARRLLALHAMGLGQKAARPGGLS